MEFDESERDDLLDRLVERVHCPAPTWGAARAEGLHRAVPGTGRRDPRAVPGDGPGRAGQGDLSRLGRGRAGRRLRTGTAAGAGRRLPDRPRDRPRWHGRGLRGRAGVAGPPGGPEGPAVAGGPGPHNAGPVPPRGPRLGPAAPHQHRAGLRRGPGRRRLLLRDAIHPRTEPRLGDRRAAEAAGPVAGAARQPADPGRRGEGDRAATRARAGSMESSGWRNRC